MFDTTGVDFSGLLGGIWALVAIKSGTGTGLSQDGKVQYLANLSAEGFITIT